RLLTAPSHAPGLGPRADRAIAGAPAPQSPRVRPPDQPVDLGTGRPGQLRPRDQLPPGEWRSHPPGAQAAGGRLEAGQALDHQPRPGVRMKKSARDRLIRLSAHSPDWVLGFQDETWWSRLARPALHAWAEDDRPLRLVE